MIVHTREERTCASYPSSLGRSLSVREPKVREIENDPERALTSSHSSAPRFTIRLSPQLSNSVGSILSSPPNSSPIRCGNELLS